MAGLSANILTSKNRAFPNWPSGYFPSESWPFYGSQGGQNASQKRKFPGFLNFGSVGSTIENALGNSTSVWTMYNGQGTAQTAGQWNGGWAVNEQWSDGDYWSAAYMDRVDNKLYCLVNDVGTSPNTYRMVSIDKDGNGAYETAAYQITSTALQGWNQAAGQQIAYGSSPLLYRTGGVDGTGNFRWDMYKANTVNDNATQPYDGVRLEINTSGGTVNGMAANTMAETTDGLIPNNIFTGDTNFDVDSMMGPTANGIMGGIIVDRLAGGGSLVGYMLNANTGQVLRKVTWNTSFGVPFYITSGYVKPFPWLGSYAFQGIGSAETAQGVWNFSRESLHNFMDEVAVYYGLL